MNKLMMIMLFFCVGFKIFAEAPELKKVLPTEWKYMTLLGEQEKREFDNTNLQLYKNEMTELFGKIYLYEFTDLKQSNLQRLIMNTDIYKQAVGSDVFYWLIYTTPPIGKEPEKRIIRLYHEDNGLDLLTLIFTPQRLEGQYYYNFYVLTVQIIKDTTGVKGFIQYVNKTEIDGNYSYREIVKKQIAGRVFGLYYLFSNKPGTVTFYNQDVLNYIPENWDKIWINASNFLWDEKDPLKYGLQNAFDGDPATSYVENTEDDLMEIEISVSISDFEKINLLAMNNGYSKSSELYIANNRVKDFELINYVLKSPKSVGKGEPIKYSFQDGIMKNQYFKFKFEKGFGPIIINCLSTYKGQEYSDTCIAEINLQAVDGKWLFGDSNE